MNTKNAILVSCISFFICVFADVLRAKDWAYECGAEAQKIYAKKKIQIPCKRIGDLLKKDDINGVYIAIRDAALFGDKTCDKYIREKLDRLKQTEGAKDAIAFYSYKNGDPSGLKLLAESYDKDAHKIGDHWTVDLFGFLNEWEMSGRRLVRHVKCCSDAVGGELLCSAIKWRRYLYGEEDFKHFWFKIGEEEKVNLEKLRHFYSTCHP